MISAPGCELLSHSVQLSVCFPSPLAKEFPGLTVLSQWDWIIAHIAGTHTPHLDAFPAQGNQSPSTWVDSTGLLLTPLNCYMALSAGPPGKIAGLDEAQVSLIFAAHSLAQ